MPPMHELICGDCLEVLPSIAPASIDAVICDPPYGTTACKWDSIIPLAPMWEQLKRVIKPRGAIVLFGSQPFTSALVMSNAKWFKYAWQWEKSRANGFVLAKKQPLRNVEDVLIFGQGAIAYYPQGIVRNPKIQKNSISAGGSVIRGDVKESTGKGNLRTPGAVYIQEYTNYPTQILRFQSVSNPVHPTQKPLDLMRYLVRTYTQAGEVILDFTAGSGSTGVAALLEGRRFIGIEKDQHYYEVAQQRLSEAAGSSAKVLPAQPTLQEALPYAD